MGRAYIQAVILSGFFFCFFLVSCRDKTDCCTVPPASGGRQVYVVCEGSMGNGNSALTQYDPARDSVYEDVYRSVNGQQLGDVFQSMTLIGDRYFLCINNSDRILMIGKDDRRLRGSLEVPKPRYILPVTASLAYVSTLFSDKVYTIDPAAGRVTGSFSMPARNPEGMLLADNNLYVCCWDTASKEVFRLDPDTREIRQRIALPGTAPHTISRDGEGKLWVLSGNVAQKKPAYLTRVDPASGQILKSYAFPEDADPIRLEWNRSRDTLYFIEVDYNGGTRHNGVYRMSIHDAVLPAQPFVAAQAYQYYWALGVEPGTGHIYIGDPRGFIQKGIVYIYRPDGSLVSRFTTGVGPGAFYFSGY